MYRSILHTDRNERTEEPNQNGGYRSLGSD